MVAIARSADEIRTHLAEAEFDLVLLNDEDDGQDGLRLCSVIRSQEATRNVPIVLMVHEGEDGRLAKGFEIGISDYLVKPLDRDEMHARARTQIRRKRYESALRVAYRRSLTAAVTDSLTGLHNRRYLETHFKALEETLRPVGKPLSLMLLDVDHFKAINDSHGHAAGDVVLQGIAGRIMGTLRGVDTAVRLGGEEFVVLMPNATLSQSLAAADRLREEIAQKPFAISGEEGSIPVTVSIGVVNAAAGEADLAALRWNGADKALYRAKAEGRDRVVVAGGRPGGVGRDVRKKWPERRIWAANQGPSPGRRVHFNLGFLEDHVLARDRVVFAELELVGRGPRVRHSRCRNSPSSALLTSVDQRCWLAWPWL